jgi:hypothetical protein
MHIDGEVLERNSSCFPYGKKERKKRVMKNYEKLRVLVRFLDENFMCILSPSKSIPKTNPSKFAALQKNS